MLDRCVRFVDLGSVSVCVGVFR
jgi:hypothetical protein